MTFASDIVELFRTYKHETNVIHKANDSELLDYALGLTYLSSMVDVFTNKTKYSQYLTEITVFAQLCQLYPQLGEMLDKKVDSKAVHSKIIQYMGHLNQKMGYPITIENAEVLRPSEWLFIWHELHKHQFSQPVRVLQKATDVSQNVEVQVEQYLAKYDHADIIYHNFLYYFSHRKPFMSQSSEIKDVLSMSIVISFFTGIGLFTWLQHQMPSEYAWICYPLMALTAACSARTTYKAVKVEKRLDIINSKNMIRHLIKSTPTTWSEVTNADTIGAAYLRGTYAAGIQPDFFYRDPVTSSLRNLFKWEMNKSGEPAEYIEQDEHKNKSLVSQYFAPTITEHVLEKSPLVPTPKE